MPLSAYESGAWVFRKSRTAAVAGSLRVGHPVAAPGLDSSHIMLVQADHRMNFYIGSRWPAPVADVLALSCTLPPTHAGPLLDAVTENLEAAAGRRRLNCRPSSATTSFAAI